MTIITAREHGLAFSGSPDEALGFVQCLREAFDKAGQDMPQTLSDLVFNVEAALQDCGALDEHFNVIAKTGG